MVIDHAKVICVTVLYHLKCANIFWQLQFSSRYEANLLVYIIGKKTFNLKTWLTLEKKESAGGKKTKST